MKRALKSIIVAVIMVALIGGYYYYLTHREVNTSEDHVEVTEFDKVLSKKLDTAYPPTPREVVKFYNRIIECAYGEKYDDKQLEQLMGQARTLLDEELLANNPIDTYKTNLLDEVTFYKDNKQKIIQTRVCNSDEVTFETINGKKCAYVTASYFIKDGKGKFVRANEKYLLRKDDNDQWKILAYRLINSKEVEES